MPTGTQRAKSPASCVAVSSVQTDVRPTAGALQQPSSAAGTDVLSDMQAKYEARFAQQQTTMLRMADVMDRLDKELQNIKTKGCLQSNVPSEPKQTASTALQQSGQGANNDGDKDQITPEVCACIKYETSIVICSVHWECEFVALVSVFNCLHVYL